ncbi:MAG: hypothetical protein ACRC06_13670 [Waterburya sp.]
MNRLKLLFLLLIIGALIIVFVQNQEPITLKLLCPDINASQACLYQTRQFPLAMWIGLFTLAGILTNLLGQVFSRYGYASSAKQKYTPASSSRYTDNDLYPDQQNWIDEDRDRSKYSTNSTPIQNSPVVDKFDKSTSYEKPQEPQNVERSGSTYSYTYRTVDERLPEGYATPTAAKSSTTSQAQARSRNVGFASSPNLDKEPPSDVKDSTPKTSNESLRESNMDAQEDDEDWI